MHDMLIDIVTKKRVDLTNAKKVLPLTELKQRALAASYHSIFTEHIDSARGTAIIAEIKFASPTNPRLGNANEFRKRAITYEQAGADALSFITERHYFKADTSYIPKLKQLVHLPILQKDFVVDEYQIYEARLIGSDALLLIARLIDGSQLQEFVALAQKLGIEPIVEINSQDDLNNAVATSTRFIAVNARNLNTFTIDLDAACMLLTNVPKTCTSLGFSGIRTIAEVARFTAAGARGVLVGTSLMQANDTAKHLRSLKGQS